MKSWIRLSIIVVIALAAIGVGLGTTNRAQATVFPADTVTENCQVSFLDGPQQGSTEAVTFTLDSLGHMAASASAYVGGQSTSGTWSFTSNKQTAIEFTFSAQLVAIPGATLTVDTTMPVSSTTVTGPASSTITESNGTVLPTVHANTTCPAFGPPTPVIG